MSFSHRRNILALFVAVTGSVVSFDTANSQAAVQIDPSSALLLSTGAGSGATPAPMTNHSADPRLESGRYTVRPRASEKAVEKSTDRTPEKPRRVPEPLVIPLPNANPIPAATPVPSVAQEPVVLAPSDSGAVVLPTETVPVEVVVEPLEKVQEFPPHILEISIASVFLYENSESPYSYRQSSMGGPAYLATARVWLSPEFGMGGQYLSTLGGQVSNRPTPTTTSTVSALRTEIALAMYFKKPFAESNLTFGLELVDSQFKVANEATSKIKTNSRGVRIGVEGEFKSPTSSWLVGFTFMPKVQHEESGTSTDVRSGDGVTAYALGASLERRWKFDDSNALFIRLEHKLERDLFSGTASKVDPLTGAAPQGVGVTVGTTLIQFGYAWGN